MTRQFWVMLHRWAGLTLALFLAVAGFTGIFLAWIDELEVAISPELFLAAPPVPGAKMLDPVVMRQQVLDRYPGGEIGYIPLEIEPGRSFQVHVHWHDPKTGGEMANAPAWDDLFLNPYTGEELGRRQWGNIMQGPVNLMPFLYRLHYSFAVDIWGQLAFGIAALIWVLDCFVGFYLTLPVRQRLAAASRGSGTGWWQRWMPSWAVRWRAASYKINFDLHRAGGLWLWPLLLVFALSSLSFNLPQVYVPAMKLLGGADPRDAYYAMLLDKPRENPTIAFADAAARGERLAATEAARLGQSVRSEGERYIWHAPETGAYIYGFTSSADISSHGGGSIVAFDSNSGAVKSVSMPSGQNGPNTFTTWISALHMGTVFGLPYRIFVSIIGALVTMLSVTGVIIWTRKRSARTARPNRRRKDHGYPAAIPAE